MEVLGKYFEVGALVAKMVLSPNPFKIEKKLGQASYIIKILRIPNNIWNFNNNIVTLTFFYILSVLGLNSIFATRSSNLQIFS